MLEVFLDPLRTKEENVEAFILLVQYHFILSPRMAVQLKLNRMVNIHGRLGKNVPCDLHLEHLNKEAKQSIAGLGSNITDKAVQRIGKSIGHTVQIAKRFDLVNGIKEQSGRHSRQSCEKDMQLLLKELCDSEVFKQKPHRKHLNFPGIQANSIKHASVSDLKTWMEGQYKKLVTYQPPQ